MTEPFSGYDIYANGEQDNERLNETAMQFSFAAMGDVLEELDPTVHLQVENQGSLPSCVGHAVSTACECVAGLECGRWEDVPQLSRMFAWHNGQQKWMGRIDWRQGCTIAHGVEAAMTDGICMEATAPYRRRENSLTGEAYRDAKRYRLVNQVEIDSADAARRFLECGFGAIVCGFVWTRRMSSCTGRLTVEDVREDGSRGGHAVPLVGFTRRGKFLLPNSWGEGWGRNSVAEVDPEAIDYLARRPYTVMRGVTDMTGFERTRTLDSWEMG